MGKAGLLHDLGYTRPIIPAAPNGTGGGLHDALVGSFLAAGGRQFGGGCSHMMIIILAWQPERKGIAII
jgi:hypothetical protein